MSFVSKDEISSPSRSTIGPYPTRDRQITFTKQANNKKSSKIVPVKTNSSEDLTKSTGMDYNKTLRGESSITNSDKGRNIDKIADSSSLVSMKKVVYDNYKSQNYQKKRKKKLIKHCADDPEEEDEVEEEEDKAPEEFYLYKFKTEEELIRTYLERYNYNLLRIAKCHSFTKTSKRELNINESAKITDNYLELCDLNELKRLHGIISRKINMKEEMSVLKYSESNPIVGRQMCFESAYKLKKKTQIKKVKNVLAPRTEKIISKLSIPSMITNEANISITSNVILTKLFDKRQLSVIRSGLCYSKNKQYIEHENGEVEMFKRNKYERDYDKYLHSINERHIRSNFSSEGPKHLRSPDEIYPHNRISRYELIDDVTYYTNPNKTKKEFNPDLELVIEDKKKSKTNEKVQDQVNQFDTFSSPLKSCSPSDYVNSNYKETNNAVRAKRVTPNSIDQESNSNKNTINRDSVDRNFERYSVPNTTKNTKLELVTILEKYHDRKEMLQEKKLHFLYKDEPIMISGKGKNKYIEEFSDYMRSYEVSDSFTESGNSKKSKGLANIKGKQKGLNTFTRLHKKVMSSDLFPVNGIPLKR